MPEIKPIGLQLYSVREALAEDFEGTMRQVADIGYIGVEPYGGLPTDLNDAAALFNELGLQVMNSHVGVPEGDGKDAMLKIAEAFNLSRVAIAYLPPEKFETLDAIKRSCEQLNEANVFAKSNNLILGYHNHWWEFKDLDGQSTLELVLSELENDIFLEVDTYWVQAGGVDVLSALEIIGERAPLIHVKDGSLDPQDSMLAVGDGKMPVPGIIDVTASTAKWYIVELDRCETDMMQAVEKSYKYLTSNGFAKGNN